MRDAMPDNGSIHYDLDQTTVIDSPAAASSVHSTPLSPPPPTLIRLSWPRTTHLL